eukprot:gene34772-30281_t
MGAVCIWSIYVWFLFLLSVVLLRREMPLWWFEAWIAGPGLSMVVLGDLGSVTLGCLVALCVWIAVRSCEDAW